jgi:hypothetical protein
MMRFLGLSLCLVLSGCSTTERWNNAGEVAEKAVEQQETPLAKRCWFVDQAEKIQHNCEMEYWLDYWVKADATPWPQRELLIAQLDDSADNILRKVLLSQPINTPYQARMRGQIWLSELRAQVSPLMQPILNVLVEKPSEHMLEFESAITVLNRINSQQNKQIGELKTKMEAQQRQLQELLNIETNLMDKNGSEQN